MLLLIPFGFPKNVAEIEKRRFDGMLEAAADNEEQVSGNWSTS